MPGYYKVALDVYGVGGSSFTLAKLNQRYTYNKDYDVSVHPRILDLKVMNNQVSRKGTILKISGTGLNVVNDGDIKIGKMSCTVLPTLF